MSRREAVIIFRSGGGDLATVITPQEAWYLGGALGITVINIYCLAAVTPRPQVGSH
jgi:hypothetical protein